MNKIYLCEVSRATWCENYACVVIAKDEDETREIIKNNNVFEKRHKVFIKEIDLNKAQILLEANVGA